MRAIIGVINVALAQSTTVDVVALVDADGQIVVVSWPTVVRRETYFLVVNLVAHCLLHNRRDIFPPVPSLSKGTFIRFKSEWHEVGL